MTQQFKFGDRVKRKSDGVVGVMRDAIDAAMQLPTED